MFFLLDTLQLGDRELALVPLTLYLSGLATTGGLEKLNACAGRKGSYLVGGMVVLLACAGFQALQPATAHLVYPCCVVSPPFFVICLRCRLSINGKRLRAYIHPPTLFLPPSFSQVVTAHSMANNLLGVRTSVC